MQNPSLFQVDRQVSVFPARSRSSWRLVGIMKTVGSEMHYPLVTAASTTTVTATNGRGLLQYLENSLWALRILFSLVEYAAARVEWWVDNGASLSVEAGRRIWKWSREVTFIAQPSRRYRHLTLFKLNRVLMVFLSILISNHHSAKQGFSVLTLVRLL
jgi:hypothetical protein